MAIVAIEGYRPLGAHATLDLTANAGVAQTPAVPTNAGGVLIQATGGNVRFTLDGQTPTATLGFQLLDGGQPVLVPLGTTTALKVIKEGAAGSLQIQFVVTP